MKSIPENTRGSENPPSGNKGGGKKNDAVKSVFRKILEKLKKIKFSTICLVTFIAFLIFGILGIHNILNAKRIVNATADFKGRIWANQALKKEAAAAGSYGIVKTKIDRFYLQTKNGLVQNHWGKYYLDAGDAVLQTQPEKKPKIVQGIAYTEVMLPKKDGSFPSDKKIWVETSMFYWIDAGDIILGKFSIIKLEEGEVWKIYFYTDEVVTILDNFKIGQKIIISGAPEGELKWPGNSDRAKEYTVPQGIVITNKEQNSLLLKYKNGGKITIKFV